MKRNLKIFNFGETIKTNIENRVMRITPQVAQKMLDTMGKNRPLRDPRVDEYKKKILAGEWKLTHQGVAFNEDGKLVDGQHRLNAIIELGNEFPMDDIYANMMVFINISKDAVKAMDVGAKRSTSDHLYLSPKEGGVIQHIARLVYRNHATLSQTENVRDMFGQEIAFLVKEKKHDKTFGCPAALTGMLYSLLTRKVSPQNGEKIYHALTNFRNDPDEVKNLTNGAKVFAKAKKMPKNDESRKMLQFLGAISFDPSFKGAANKAKSDENEKAMKAFFQTALAR